MSKARYFMGSEIEAIRPQLFEAWINNRIEIDKQTLLLSYLAIGVLVFVLYDKGDSAWYDLFWIVANICLLLAIGTTLLIHNLNTIMLADALYNDEEEKIEKSIRKITKRSSMSRGFFWVGALITAILAIAQLEKLIDIGKSALSMLH